MRLGDYELESEIGRGGVGAVFLARSKRGEAVALKLLLRSSSGPALERFERERRLLDELGREGGFVPLLDAGDSPRGPFLVMPFFGGGTLRDRLVGAGPLATSSDERGRQLTVDETLSLGRTLAAALGRAHERGIVHRDLKPENVLFGDSGEPVIADLGLAKHFRDDAPGAGRSVSLTRAGELRGTAGYMAPEQMHDAKEALAPADVFALGAILYECLAGVPAFSGDSAIELLVKVDSGQLTPLRQLRPETPEWLARAIERALSRDPRARFPDGKAFAAALSGKATIKKKRGKRAFLSFLVLAIVGLALGAVFLFSPQEDKREPETAAVHSKVAAGKAPDRAKTAEPAWFRELPELLRPRRLPAGVSFGKKPGEYLNEADLSVLVFVPAGSFEVREPTGKTRREHTLEFFISKYETRYEQFAAFVAATGHKTLAEEQGKGMVFHPDPDLFQMWPAKDGASWRDPEGEGRKPRGDEPVVQLSRADAAAYARWAKARLPLEPEWQKAGGWEPLTGRTRTFPWGEERPRAGSPAFANFADKQLTLLLGEPLAEEYDDGFALRAPVGSFPLDVSPVGACDMAGNVSEWCDGKASGQATAHELLEAVPCCGASFCENPGAARLSKTYSFPPDMRSNAVGMRIAVSADTR